MVDEEDGEGKPEATMEENIDSKDKVERPDMQETLRHRLMGPSLTKAGQDTVDQSKVCSQAIRVRKPFHRVECSSY